MPFSEKGFRDLVTDLDCLRYRARIKDIDPGEFAEKLLELVGFADVSMDPRVKRLLLPAIFEAMGTCANVGSCEEASARN
jgi:hypothetical protein